MTISRRLARLHGGDIHVSSVWEEGTTFRLELPAGDFDRAQVVQVTPGRQQQRSQRTIAMLPTLAGRVLLAEDNPTNQQLVGRILKRAGLEVAIANNGAEAVDLVEATRESGDLYDVVLMDMQMPVLDGLSATRRLRELGHTLPIVALTANAMNSDREACLGAGCTDFATKPIDRRKLLEAIRRLLESPAAT